MPSQLALLLFIAFVIFVLRLDRKQAPDSSAFLWIPTVWALVYFGRPLGVWFEVRDSSNFVSNMETGSSLDRTFLLILFGLAIFVLNKRKFPWLKAFRDNRWLLILVAFMLVSVSWSSMPFISLKRWTRELVAVFMGFMILSEHDPARALMSVLRRVSYILIPASILMVKYYPAYGVEFNRWTGTRMWIGVATQKNGLARICVIAVIFMLWMLIRRVKRIEPPVAYYQVLIEMFIMMLALFLMMGPNMSLTYSATSTVSLVLAIMTIGGLHWLRNRNLELGVKAIKVLVIVIVFYGTTAPFIGKLPILDISSYLGRDSGLTDRNVIWERLLPFALARPLLGHGFGGFWTTEMRNLTSSHSHNGYLDVVLNLGFIGLILISVYLLSCCRKAQETVKYDFERGALSYCYIIMLVVFNIAESSINSVSASLPALVMFFSMTSSNLYKDVA